MSSCQLINCYCFDEISTTHQKQAQEKELKFSKNRKKYKKMVTIPPQKIRLVLYVV